MKRHWKVWMVAAAFCFVAAGVCAAQDNAAAPQAAAAETAVQPDLPEGPVAFFPEPRYTFEEVLEGASVSHDYVVRNIGSEELRIERVRTS